MGYQIGYTLGKLMTRNGAMELVEMLMKLKITFMRVSLEMANKKAMADKLATEATTKVSTKMTKFTAKENSSTQTGQS